jgi:hypothetical protein
MIERNISTEIRMTVNLLDKRDGKFINYASNMSWGE